MFITAEKARGVETNCFPGENSISSLSARHSPPGTTNQIPKVATAFDTNNLLFTKSIQAASGTFRHFLTLFILVKTEDVKLWFDEKSLYCTIYSFPSIFCRLCARILPKSQLMELKSGAFKDKARGSLFSLSG